MHLADRREFLRAGAVALGGLTLPDLFAARAASGQSSCDTAVILLYLHGGHAQQETWDPKPDGPLPERGEFGAIATSVPGVRVGELLPS